MSLTDTERAVLDFAGRIYKYPGAREADVRAEFGWSAVRHAQVELALIDRAEAWEYAPGVVKRLRRLRDQRAAARSAARFRADSGCARRTHAAVGGFQTLPVVGK